MRTRRDDLRLESIANKFNLFFVTAMVEEELCTQRTAFIPDSTDVRSTRALAAQTNQGYDVSDTTLELRQPLESTTHGAATWTQTHVPIWIKNINCMRHSERQTRLRSRIVTE